MKSEMKENSARIGCLGLRGNGNAVVAPGLVTVALWSLEV